MAENNENNQWALQVSKWLLDKALFLLNLDLYQIYRPNEKIAVIYHANNHHHHHHEGISLRDKSMRWRKYSKLCYRVSSIFTTYFLLKTTIINSLRCILYKVDQKPETCWWPNCQETLLAAEKLLGNPMSELGGQAIFFTWALAGMTFLFATFIPYYWNHTLDLPALELFYQPQGELQRLDQMIDHRLNNFLESILNYQANQCKATCGYPKINDNESIIFNRKSVKQIHQQLIDYKNGDFVDLRPDYFEGSNRLRASLLAAWIINVFYLFFFCWVVAFAVPMIDLVAITKCRAMMNFDHCSLSQAFSWQEDIYLLELALIGAITYTCMTFYNGNIQIQLRSNSCCVVNMKSILERCLWHLRVHNTIGMGRQRLKTISEKQEKEIEKDLLENFIKILVTSDELRRGTQSVTQLLTPWFVQAFVLVVLFVMIDGMDTKSFKILIRSAILTYWLILNHFSFLAARILSQTFQLQRLHWSIHAELIVYYQGHPMNETSFVPLVWRRLSKYSRSISYLYTTKPLKIVLTYRRIIEINFSIISVVLLSLSH